MKDTLKRMLGMAPAPAQAETQEETITMDVTETTSEAAPSAETPVVDVAELQASLASVTTELAAAKSKIAELTTEVQAAVEFNAARDKAAAEAKLTARKEKIVAAVGTEKADTLMAATASMEDGAFHAVMAALSTTQAVEAKTALFSEVGVEAEADPAKLAAAASNPVMDYLTAKYAKQA